jgi:hypothetical protein
VVIGSFLFAAFLLAYTHTAHTMGSTSSIEETSDIHVISLAATTGAETAHTVGATNNIEETSDIHVLPLARPPVVEDARQTWGRGQQRRQPQKAPQPPPLPELAPEEPVQGGAQAAEEEEEAAEEEEEEEAAEEEEVDLGELEKEEEDEKLKKEFEADIFDEEAADAWEEEEEYEEEDAAALEELAAEEEEEEEQSGDLDAESWDDNGTLDELDDSPVDEEEDEDEEELELELEEVEEVEEGNEQPQREKQHQHQHQHQHQQKDEHEEEEKAGLAPVAVAAEQTHTDAEIPLVKPKAVRKIQNRKQQSAPHQQQQQQEEEVVVVPQMLYCLPGGGFNDIVIQLWRCVEYAVKTQRVLILGWENYLPVLPPYEQYFYLNDIPGLTLMSQWEAASIIRAAQAAGQKVTHSAGKRLDLTALLGTGEEKEDGLPFFIEAASMPNYIFDPEKTYTHHVLIYHKKGNKGTPETTLQHLLFSDEVKHTFLSRWGQLQKPYIGMHVRGTDRKCGEKKAPKVLKKVQQLRQRLKGAPVYLATDNPEAAVEQIEELEGRQGREIVSFTYFPDKKEGEEEEGKAEEEKKVVPLHLNKALSDEEKHQTNIDGFVDLLLLAFSQKFVMSCGGYSKLAKLLHEDKGLALGTLGLELEEGGEDVNAVLEEALKQQQQREAEGAEAEAQAEAAA